MLGLKEGEHATNRIYIGKNKTHELVIVIFILLVPSYTAVSIVYIHFDSR